MHASHRLTAIARRSAAAALVALIAGSFALVAGCSANSHGQRVTNNVNGTPFILSAPGAFQQNTGTHSTTIKWDQTKVASSCGPISGSFLPGSFDSSGTFTPTAGVNPTVVAVDNSGVAAPRTSGSIVVAGLATAQVGEYTFQMTCQDASGNALGQPVATVVDVFGGSGGAGGADIPFTVSPETLTQGGSGAIRLIWNHPSASSCTLKNPDGTTETETTSGNESKTVDATTAGTKYTYTLTCPGYSGSPETVTATVAPSGTTTAGQPQQLVAFPSPSIAGQPVQLTWSQPDAASCTLERAYKAPGAAGFTDPDPNFNSGAPLAVGAVPDPTDASHVPPYADAALTQAGTYRYTLSCKDGNGQPVPIEDANGNPVQDANGQAVFTDTATVTVNPAATMQPQELTAYPTTTSSPVTTTPPTDPTPVQLTWSQPDAATCTVGRAFQAPGAAGFTNPDPNFNGGAPLAVSATPDTSDSSHVPPLNETALSTPGTYKYSLKCFDGSGSLVPIEDANGNPVMDTNGALVYESTATVTVNPAAAATVNNACRLTTQNAATQTIVLNTNDPNHTDTFATLPADNSAAQLISGICLGCSVTDPGNILTYDPATPDLNHYAKMLSTVGLLGGSVSLRLKNTTAGATYAAGTLPGFVVIFPQQALGAGALQTINIRTLLRDANGDEQFTGDVASGTENAGGHVKAQALGLIGGGSQVFVGFSPDDPTTSAYDAIQVDLNATANVTSQLQVYYGCVVGSPPQTP